MKKIITLLLCTFVLLSLLSCDYQAYQAFFAPQNQEEIISTDPKIAYGSILEMYRFAIERFHYVNQNPQALLAELNLKTDEEKNCFSAIYSSGYLFYPGGEKDDSQSLYYRLKCGYAIKDLNKDGVDELVLLNENYTVVAIFSYADEKAILLGNYTPQGSCRIDGDGLIHVFSSSGTAYLSHSVYKIANGGKELELIVEFGSDGYEWIDGVAHTKHYKLLDGDKVTITRTEYRTLAEQYGNHLDSDAGAHATKKYSGLEFTSLFIDETEGWPISPEEATAIACEHWNVENGAKDYYTGNVCECKITVREYPNENNGYYHVVWNVEITTAEWIGAEDGWIPSIYHKGDLLVNATTGEIKSFPSSGN